MLSIAMGWLKENNERGSCKFAEREGWEEIDAERISKSYHL